tara:strand:+ start:17500 stop:18768 length:1269 start_codon:yes stop_codon:yes gene_type:complete
MNITFFFPYPYISGIPVLFSNLTNYLLKDNKHEINIIDYKNGALIRNCKPNLKLKFIEFKDFESCVLDFETNLIIQAGLPHKLRQELKISKKVKILQWAAHESNLIPYLSRFNFILKIQQSNLIIHKIFHMINRKNYKILSMWVSKMIDRGSIVFMTEEIYNNTIKYLFLKDSNSVTYLPNFSFGDINYNYKIINRKSKKIINEINLAWVGRIADFKIHILNYSIKKLCNYSLKTKTKINFHIIGTGKLKSKLRFDFQNQYFKIVELGAVEKSEVDKYLQTNIDVMFSMGTSALDGARLGIPVILLDQSNVEIKDGYIFKFLFDSKGFDLGHPVSKLDFKIGNNSLEKIIKGLKSNYKILSKKTLKYYNENHSIEIVSKKLINLINNNSVYFLDEIDSTLFKQSLLRKLYFFYLRKIRKSYY